MRSEGSAFDDVRARYIVFVWLLLLFYLPGAELAFESVAYDWPWYWLDVAYWYWGHALFALTLLVAGVLLGKIPLKACVGRQPTRAEVIGGLELTAFLFVTSVALIYATYYPLSLVAPEFVQWWYIDTLDVFYFDAGTYPFLPNLLQFLSLCVIAPILEEVGFRGIILPRWARKWGLRSAILGSSAVFGLVHPDPLGAFLFGIGMSVLYLKTQSLLLPILCHAFHNLVVWVLELGDRVSRGPEYVYTLEEFRAEWLWGVVCAVVAVCWIARYSKLPKSTVPWKLPVP
jgi:membrane protease YdiL (CAAX protease family)